MSRPVRTCIGCRGQADKAELLRLVWQPATASVVADPRQREPGRGAYLHRTSSCLDAAVRRRSLARALRVSGLAPEVVTAVVATHLLAKSSNLPQHTL